jgi:gliding motility-associated-like protein
MLIPYFMSPKMNHKNSPISVSARIFRHSSLWTMTVCMLLMLGISVKGFAQAPIIDVPINGSIADGVATDKVTVKFSDGSGGYLLGQNVSFSVGGLNFASQTDGAGTYFLTLSSNVVQTNTPVLILLNNVVIGTAYVTFVPGPPSTSAPGAPTGPSTPGNPTGTTGTLLSVELSGAVADGTSVDSVKAHITDASGNALANVSVTLTIVAGGDADATADAKFSNGTQTITGTTDAAGNVIIPGYTDIPITDITPGTVWIIATIDTNPGVPINGSPAKVTFVVGPPVPVAPGAPTGPTTPDNPTGTTGTLLSVELTGAIANGVAVDSVKAHITDATGRALANVSVTLTIVTGGDAGATADAKFSNGTQTIQGVTDAAGNVVIPGGYVDIPITDITPGIVWISASIDVNPGPIFGSPAKVTFVLGPPVPGDPGGGGSGGTPPGGGGIPPPPGGGGGPGGPGGGNPGGGGLDTGTNSNNGYTVLFVTQDYQLADGKHQDSVYAYVTTAQKQPVPGASVKFFIQNTPASGTATASAQLVGQASTTTNGDGLAGIGVVSTKPGTVFIDGILTVNGVDVLIDSSYRIVTFLNAPDVTNPQTNLSVVIYQALADGTQQTAVKAHIVDLDGTAMPDQEVTFTIDSGDAVIVTPQPVTTDGNGDAVIYITSKKPGYVLITATINGESITFGSPARVKFAPINIYVPPVFTPNGDGTNDVLKPILVGISTFHYFSVYNRWGNLIFTTQDPNVGWDGRFKGVAQPVETYLWIAEGIDVQGNKVVQKGMTSLVR